MNPPPHSIRVLIIDDHPTLVWGLERLIGSQSPHMEPVASTDDPEAALALVQRHQPDVVLLDLVLGERCGLSVLPQLVGSGARVLVLTGERRPDMADQAVRLGARGVLGKDAPAEQVIKAIEKVHQGEIWLDRRTLGRVLHRLVTPTADPQREVERQRQASLTPRERKIVQAVLAGHGASNKVLAARLFISEHTLRNHLSAIYHKLGVGNRLELYVYALKHPMEPPPGAPQGLAA